MLPRPPILTAFALALTTTVAAAESVTLAPVADTGLFEFAPDHNLGGTAALQIGTNSQGTVGRGLYRFDVSSAIPAGSRIVSASARFEVTAAGGDASEAHLLIPVRLGWTEGDKSGGHGAAAAPGETTWNSRQHGTAEWTGPGGAAGNDFAAEASASSGFLDTGPQTFASTPALVRDVQRWLAEPASNHGWLLTAASERAGRSSRRVATREMEGLAPSLTIQFEPLRIHEVSSGDHLEFTWDGAPPVVIEHATTPLGSWGVIQDSPPPSTFRQPISTSRGFYRIRQAPPTPAARYRVTWEASWSNTTHPGSFPAGAHFTALFGATHSGDFQLWEPGALATLGIKQMAESGSNTTLRSELEAAIASARAQHLLSGSGTVSPGQTSLTFEISQGYPLVSLVCMIAPSPDWFVGVNGLALFERHRWLETKTVALQAYDAGTDSEASYTSANSVTSPPEPITRISPAGETRPLGTLTFERIE